MVDKKSSPQQIAQSVYDIQSNAITVRDATNLIPSEYNEIQLTYNGANTEPSAVTYLLNTVIIAILSFEYDINGRVTRVYRST